MYSNCRQEIYNGQPVWFAEIRLDDKEFNDAYVKRVVAQIFSSVPFFNREYSEYMLSPNDAVIVKYTKHHSAAFNDEYHAREFLANVMNTIRSTLGEKIDECDDECEEDKPFAFSL